MANIVDSLVVRKNNFEYPNGIAEAINCEQATVEGLYWRVPTSSKGVQTGYDYRVAQAGVAKPTLDSLKVLRVNDGKGNVYFIAVTDGAATTVFTNLCKACCDDSQVMPAVTIPDPVVEETGCADANGNYNYFSVTRALGAGEKYYLTASLNGAALSPAPPPEGFDSLAALETWVEANWGPATITIAGTKVTLTTATGTTGSISVGVRSYFESNAPGALASGEKYHVAATLNGTVLAPVEGIADALLTTIDDLLNANATWATYGQWSVVGGKIRLVSDTVTTATIVVTKV